MEINSSYIDVSHSAGIPFGALGTGWGMFGRFGFVFPNFDGCPHNGKYTQLGALKNYDYIEPHDDERVSFMAISLNEGGRTLLLQEHDTGWYGAETVDELRSYAFLPFGVHKMKSAAFGINAELLMFSPMCPHNIDESSIPVLCMELTIEDTSGREREISVGLEFNPSAKHESENGGIAYKLSDDGILSVEPNGKKTVKLFFGWYFEKITTPSPFLTETYSRYYTRLFKNADEAVETAEKNHERWKAAIDRWHSSFDIPAPLKRLCFASLSSVITSTILTSEPLFFEIESPHPWVNTMGVSIYSSWIYMINWPEIEKMDMRLYTESIPKDGEDKGLIWHSLWTDKAHYDDEPNYILRTYRDYLWYNDIDLLHDSYETLTDAFLRVYNKQYDCLIDSKHGNQCYDVWKMPGINAYVNAEWVYAVYAMKRICEETGNKPEISGCGLDGFMKKAAESYDKYLWNGKYYNCFFRTPGAREINYPETVFTDAMFGRWLMTLDMNLPDILDEQKVERTVRYAYKNNLVTDSIRDFRGWANGMLDGGIPLDGSDHQYHVKTCWIGAQLDMGSLLAEYGDERAFYDVLTSLEAGLHNNHLAVGEWNKSVFPDGAADTLPEEPCKDTPRFPAYPRYKSCWEYIARLLGMKMNKTRISLKPFKTVGFSLKNVTLAGMRLDVRVKEGWKKILINGAECGECMLDREQKEYTVEFC